MNLNNIPQGFGSEFRNWLIQAFQQTQGQINGVAQMVGSPPTVISNEVPYGDSNNQMTSDPTLTYDTNYLATQVGIALPGMYKVDGNAVSVNPKIPDASRGMYYNPSGVIASEEITLPSTPVDGMEGIILFGGSVSSGVVVTVLSFASSFDIVGVNDITTAKANTCVRYKFRADLGASGTYYLSA